MTDLLIQKRILLTQALFQKLLTCATTTGDALQVLQKPLADAAQLVGLLLCKVTNAAGTWPDLTGATINFKAAYQLQPTNSFTEATGSVVVASGANQQVRIEIDGTDTAGLPAGSYEYDVEATLSSGNTVTLVSSEGNQDVDLTLLESHAP